MPDIPQPRDNKGPEGRTHYYFRHKFKCLECSLHFVVLSYFEQWPPPTGSKRIFRCPECANQDERLFLRRVEKVYDYILFEVPGLDPPPGPHEWTHAQDASKATDHPAKNSGA